MYLNTNKMRLNRTEGQFKIEVDNSDNINQFYKTLKVVFSVSLITGIFPMIIVRKEGKYKLLFSNNFFITTVAVGCIFTWLLSKTSYHNFDGALMERYYIQPLARIGAYCEIVSSCIVTFIIMFFSGLCSRHFKDIFETLAKVDDLLISIGHNFDYNRYTKWQIALIFTESCMSIFTMIFNQILMVYNKEQPHTDLIAFSFVAFPITFTCVFAGIVTIIMINTYWRFQVINGILDSIRGNGKDNWNIQGRELRAIIQKIEVLKQVYYKLCQSSYIANKYLNIPMMPVTLHQFWITTFSLFFWWYMHDEKPFSALCWLSWGGLKFFEVLQITATCHLAKRESEITGRKIHKILIHNRNKNIEDKLMTFSNQVLQDKFNFTLAGLFKVDATLLFNIIGSSSTYIVILIQFQEASAPPDCLQFINATKSH